MSASLGLSVLLTLLVAIGPAVAETDAVPEPATKPPPETFVEPNARDSDGTPAYVHVVPEQMPLRVSIGYPKLGIRHGTREDGRSAAIDGIREWERALAARLPWFALDVVELDVDAPVQVEWRRRLAGSAAGRGGTEWKVVDGELRVGGRMLLTTSHPVATDHRLTADELRLLVAHEFGHVLGLGHCHHCDSVMNYSWETQERVIVTELDVRTFEALLRMPNGIRSDGQLLIALRGAPAPESD